MSGGDSRVIREGGEGLGRLPALHCKGTQENPVQDLGKS